MKRYTIYLRNENKKVFIITNVVHMPVLCEELRRHYKSKEFTIIDVENVEDNEIRLLNPNRYFIRYEDEDNATDYM